MWPCAKLEAGGGVAGESLAPDYLLYYSISLNSSGRLKRKRIFSFFFFFFPRSRSFGLLIIDSDVSYQLLSPSHHRLDTPLQNQAPGMRLFDLRLRTLNRTEIFGDSSSVLIALCWLSLLILSDFQQSITLSFILFPHLIHSSHCHSVFFLRHRYLTFPCLKSFKIKFKFLSLVQSRDVLPMQITCN